MICIKYLTSERKAKNLIYIRCTKNQDEIVLTQNEEISDRRMKYFFQKFNRTNTSKINLKNTTRIERQCSFYCRIRKEEVNEGLRKIKSGKQ